LRVDDITYFGLASSTTALVSDSLRVVDAVV
jgi:hypothetical protein